MPILYAHSSMEKSVVGRPSMHVLFADRGGQPSFVASADASAAPHGERSLLRSARRGVVGARTVSESSKSSGLVSRWLRVRIPLGVPIQTVGHRVGLQMRRRDSLHLQESAELSFGGA